MSLYLTKLLTKSQKLEFEIEAGTEYFIVNFVLGSVTNYGSKMENVQCSSIQRMVVESANYGDFNKNGIFSDDKNIDTTCSALASCQVKSRCNGKRSCDLTMDNGLLQSQYCPDTSKQIYTKYTCRDTYDTNTITTGNVNSRMYMILHTRSTKNQKLLKTGCNSVFGATLFNVFNNIVKYCYP